MLNEQFTTQKLCFFQYNPTRNNMVEYTTGFETDFLFLLHDAVLP